MIWNVPIFSHREFEISGELHELYMKTYASYFEIY